MAAVTLIKQEAVVVNLDANTTAKASPGVRMWSPGLGPGQAAQPAPHTVQTT